jgi:hypothetical protein
MSETLVASKSASWFRLIRQAIRGEEMDYTTGSIRRAVIMLAIPMMLEMIMESVFAVVDLYFVGHLENGIRANDYLFSRDWYEHGSYSACSAKSGRKKC